MTRPEDSLTVGGGAAHQRQAPGADRLVNGLVYQIRFFEKATMNHEELFLSWRLNALNAWENSNLPPTYEWQKEVKSVSALIRIFSIGSSDPSLSNCPGPNPTMIFLFTTKGYFLNKKFGNILSWTSVDCYGTLNPQFHFDLLLFHLAQGLRTLPLTLKSAKNFFYFTFLKVVPETKCLP